SYSGSVDRDSVFVEFYSNRIEQELAALGRRVWGPERPLTLLWIAIDNGDGERVLLSSDGVGIGGLADTVDLIGVSPEMTALADDIRAQIQAIADERGLPIAFPLLDLADLTSVMPADIWGGFDEPVTQASERYGADAILI